MADGTLKVGEITNSAGSGNITIGSGVTVNVNRPAFSVTLSTSQTISTATVTKIQFNTVVLDTDSCYSTSNYRFTPTQAGKYIFLTTTRIEGTGANANSRILKNGSLVSFVIAENSASGQETFNNIIVLDMNGSTDYVEAYAEQNAGSDKSVYGDNAGAGSTTFHGYKLGA